MLIKKAMSRMSGTRYAQACLERVARVSHYLSGIGSGSDVVFSGERSIFTLLEARYRPPYCVFDVGSNKGQFLRLILENLPAENISVHCFEPGRATFKLLEQSARELRAGDNVKLNNIGLGKERGVSILHSDALGSGLASLTKRNLEHYKISFEESEQVDVETIDEYCRANAVDHIHLLKIDIEGHELDALSGAAGMFGAGSIDVATFEFGGCNIDTRTYFRDFWYFFQNAHMQIYRITPSGYLHPIAAYSEGLEQFMTTNFIAVSNRGC